MGNHYDPSDDEGTSHATGVAMRKPETADEQRERTLQDAIKLLVPEYFTLKSTVKVHLTLSQGARKVEAVGETRVEALKSLLRKIASDD